MEGDHTKCWTNCCRGQVQHWAKVAFMPSSAAPRGSSKTRQPRKVIIRMTIIIQNASIDNTSEAGLTQHGEWISLWLCSDVMRAQVALIVAFGLSAFLGLSYHIFFLTIPDRFSRVRGQARVRRVCLYMDTETNMNMKNNIIGADMEDFIVVENVAPVCLCKCKVNNSNDFHVLGL